jgi:enamine deaminase RidA (YjgF/YER057c/UK114 family)
MKKKLIPSTSPYAQIMGFSRAVRVGEYIVVGGTAPIDSKGNTIGLNDPSEQARACIETIKFALEEAGSSLSDVVRTRVFLKNINDWNQVAKVRGEYFKEIMPVDTVMEVSRFINEEWLLEIEVDAIVCSK